MPDGQWAVTDPVRLQLSRLGALVEGRAAKLVFVNATPSVRHLAYVDFDHQPIRVREFGDAANVFHPAISPDGQWVAYGTAAEGMVAGSDLYVRRLDSDIGASVAIGPGFIPRWWVRGTPSWCIRRPRPTTCNRPRPKEKRACGS